MMTPTPMTPINAAAAPLQETATTAATPCTKTAVYVPLQE